MTHQGLTNGPIKHTAFNTSNDLVCISHVKIHLHLVSGEKYTVEEILLILYANHLKKNLNMYDLTESFNHT